MLHVAFGVLYVEKAPLEYHHYNNINVNHNTHIFGKQNVNYVVIVVLEMEENGK